MHFEDNAIVISTLASNIKDVVVAFFQKTLTQPNRLCFTSRPTVDFSVAFLRDLVELDSRQTHIILY